MSKKEELKARILALFSEKDTKHACLKDFDYPFVINVDIYASR